MKILAAAAAATITLSPAPADPPKAPTILVGPDRPLMDQRVNLTVFGLTPNAPVTVTARSVAQDGVVWRSAATFRANATGAVWPSEQAPMSGSYRGVDGMGLFWSMTADAKAGHRQAFAAQDLNRPQITAIAVSQVGRPAASRVLERRFSWGGIRATSVRGGVTGV